MAKKSFKDNTTNIDKYFSTHDTQDTQSTHDEQKAQYTENTQEIQEIVKDIVENQSKYEEVETSKKNYRINLKLRPEFRKYLDDESWKVRKSITEYINDLIQADKDSKSIDNEK